MEFKVTSNNEYDTIELAQNLESEKFPNMIICLTGDLGSGKTVFAKGFANALGISEVVNSPTFTIIKEYLGYKQSRQSQIIKNTLLIGMNEYSTYAKHWEGNSWKDEESRQFQIERREKGWKFKRFLRNPDLMNWLERNGETKISKLYVFLTYDFLDNGSIYFIKRLLKKVFRK